MGKHLGYLSAGPRVSTRPDAELSGPRSHILGVIGAFKTQGWHVSPFIVGDRLPSKMTGKNSEKELTSNWVKTLLADFARLVFSVLNSRRAWGELGGKVDWVYERFASLQSLGWIFQRHGIPWILETNALLFYESKRERKSIVLGGLARTLELKAYRNCDVLVCISSALKEIIIQEAQIPEQKIIVVPNGVDTDHFNPVNYPPKRLFSSFTLGFVGGLYPWQALDLLLTAIADLRKEGKEIFLVIVGDGAMRQKWENYAQTLNMTDRVTFVGSIAAPEVPQYLAGFDICYSGQVQLEVGKMYLSPLKLYEYLAMAKPVIASAFEDAKELICHQETGWLFTPGDLSTLKQAIVNAYESRENLKQMGQQGRQRILAHHSWNTRVQTMIAQAEKILNNPH